MQKVKIKTTPTLENLMGNKTIEPMKKKGAISRRKNRNIGLLYAKSEPILTINR